MPPKYTFQSTPILLLKTKSSPQDSYEAYFSAHDYSPVFIPVLEHHFHEQNLQWVRELFDSGALQPSPERKYGGLIFTSQRAVEGFASAVSSLSQNVTIPSSQNLPLYTVGPATARSLTTLRDAHLPHASIHGADTGNGENLARYILEHYNSLPYPHAPSGASSKPPLLFLVGEQRRDVIPRMLMREAPEGQRIVVDERVVYESGVMEGFEGEFAEAVGAVEEFLSSSSAAAADGGVEGSGEKKAWVVVFSPTGCEAMLRVLGSRKGVYVATIGPTTRDHLVRRFGVQPAKTSLSVPLSTTLNQDYDHVATAH
ncbi:tetrapyrrole biosynthesis, uroporphyrinogen III synthase [Aspergillus floccosus]